MKYYSMLEFYWNKRVALRILKNVLTSVNRQEFYEDDFWRSAFLSNFEVNYKNFIHKSTPPRIAFQKSHDQKYIIEFCRIVVQEMKELEEILDKMAARLSWDRPEQAVHQEDYLGPIVGILLSVIQNGIAQSAFVMEREYVTGVEPYFQYTSIKLKEAHPRADFSPIKIRIFKISKSIKPKTKETEQKKKFLNEIAELF